LVVAMVINFINSSPWI